MAQINAQASDDGEEDSDTLTQLLATQNRLLCDILLTMEELTARLAAGQAQS